MAKLKDYHWVSEDRKEFTKWNEEALFSKLDIQSRRVFFRIPRNRVFESDGGDGSCSVQTFESNCLPEYVEGTIEGVHRVAAKKRIAISLQPLEFSDGAQLELRGANGWKNGTAILNHFCKAICSQEGVVSARNIMLSDLIGTDWKENLKYTFKKQQYSVESFLQGRQEEPGTIRTYPTWKASKSRDFGLFDECIYEEMSLECLNFWLATKVAMPVAKFQGGHDGLIYSMAYYENGHVCMDSGIFGTNGRELGFLSECEWGTENNVRAVVFIGQQAFEDSQGPIIIPD